MIMQQWNNLIHEITVCTCMPFQVSGLRVFLQWFVELSFWPFPCTLFFLYFTFFCVWKRSVWLFSLLLCILILYRLWYDYWVALEMNVILEVSKLKFIDEYYEKYFMHCICNSQSLERNITFIQGPLLVELWMPLYHFALGLCFCWCFFQLSI